jgi:hypothetical protein
MTGTEEGAEVPRNGKAYQTYGEEGKHTEACSCHSWIGE